MATGESRVITPPSPRIRRKQWGEGVSVWGYSLYILIFILLFCFVVLILIAYLILYCIFLFQFHPSFQPTAEFTREREHFLEKVTRTRERGAARCRVFSGRQNGSTRERLPEEPRFSGRQNGSTRGR